MPRDRGIWRGPCRGTVKPEPEGIGANMPGPSGFRPAGARFVGALARSPATRCARLRADRRTGRETECFYLTLKGSRPASIRP